jgi:hypothetical protein
MRRDEMSNKVRGREEGGRRDKMQRDKVRGRQGMREMRAERG